MSKADDSVEIEIKVQIANSNELREFLEKNGKYLGESHQIDAYYSPAHKDYLSVRPIEEWLRVRDSSGNYSINYKKWHYEKDGRSHFCDEYETVVGDIAKLEMILEALGMKVVVKVDKMRRAWICNDYEVALDSVEGLGDFVEIEYKGDLNQRKPQEITDEMLSFLRRFNVGEISRNYVGYPFQLLFPKEVEYEKL